jgi:hypothetical protein
MSDSSSSTLRRVFIHTPTPDTERPGFNDTLRYYYASRAIPLLTPVQDIVVLPKGDECLVQFWNWACCFLGYKNSQVIWTTGKTFSLYSELDEVQQQLPSNEELEVIPHTNHTVLKLWCEKHKYKLKGDNTVWKHSCGHKGILHQQKEQLAALGIPILPGIFVPNRNNIVACYKQFMKELHLKNSTDHTPDVYVKPVLGTSGRGIKVLHSLNDAMEYQQHSADMDCPYLIEEAKKIDHYPDGTCSTPSVIWNGTDVITCSDQITSDDVKFLGNEHPPRCSDKVKDLCRAATHRLLEYIQPQGYGGVDFIVSDGEPYMVDINAGRLCASHHPFLTLQKFGRQNDVAYRTLLVRITVDDVFKFWKQLENNSLAFYIGNKSSTSGAFILASVKDRCFLMMVAPTITELNSIEIKLSPFIKVFEHTY